MSWFDSNIHVKFPLCGCEPESTIHLFQRCQVAQVLWFRSCGGLKVMELPFSIPHQLVNIFVNLPKDLMGDKQRQDICL